MSEEEKKQIQTLISYVNVQLECSHRKISKITDISTGIDLFFLLKSLCERYSKDFPILVELEIEDCDKPEIGQKNIQIALKWLENSENLDLSSVTKEGIFKKDEEMSVFLTWQIVIYFHFYSGGYKLPQSKKVVTDYHSFYEEILEWSNEILIENGTVEEINNLSDWKSGIPLYIIITTLFSSNADDETFPIDTDDAGSLIRSCLEFADEKMGIPNIITIEEFLDPEPVSIAIYLQYFRMFDELNQITAAASETSSTDADDLETEVLILRKSLEEERLYRIELNEEHKKEFGRLETLVLEKEERIKTLSNNNSLNNSSKFLNTSGISDRSTASSSSSINLKLEMEKLKVGFQKQKGEILDIYKKQLRSVILNQYERGRMRNTQEMDELRVKLEEKETEIMELKKQIDEKFLTVVQKKKKVEEEEKEEVGKRRKKVDVFVPQKVENKECCNIL